MNRKSCFFIGHRETPDNVLPLLQEAVNKHIEDDGVTEFIVGHYGNFDYLATKAVIAAKQLHPEIILSLLIPYHPAERPIKTPKGFDNTYYPPGMEYVPRKLAIVRANRYMVDHVDFLIAYAWHPASNARELVEYAEKKMEKGVIQVTNLASLHRNTFCGTSRYDENEGVVMSCPFCGEVFVRRNNRAVICGKPECHKARKAMNKRNSRKNQKISAQQSK